ncbi:MAG: ABC transporter ATP-binding protein/permease [Butyrivibrio sp.]|nr:ABC transporter ATP-binding protein/permease [Butyrivibrio sp.]
MKKQSKAIILLKMLGMVKPLLGYMLLAVICGTLAFLAVEFIPVFGAYAILTGLGYDLSISLGMIFICLIFFALARSVLRYIEQRTNHYIAFTLLAVVRDNVFKALRKLCPAKLEGRDKGDLIALITSDVELLEVFYAHTISPICIAVLSESIMCIYIGSFHILLGLVALMAYIGVGIIIPLIISKISGTTGDEIRKMSGNMSGFVFENIRGIDTTLQYDNGKERLDSLNAMTDDLSIKQGRLNILTGYNFAIANSFILVFDIIMVVASLTLFRNGELGFDGMIISIIALMSSYGPVSALSSLGTTLQGTIASGARILDILEEEPETEDISGKENIDFDNARAEHVSFSYTDEKILDDFSIEINKNKIIGILGKSGCGKSTLLKLLMRFWEVDSGAITISNVDVKDINTTNLRNMESYMNQDTQLFKDTIKENIRLAKLDATDEEIVEACKKASIHDFIMTLPDGYNTQVGELGDTLSGGEKQRIGLARAFLHGAPFILLDEPTSNLDSLNEAVILKSLKEESKNKTVVLVSHRQSTMRISDTTVMMAK